MIQYLKRGEIDEIAYNNCIKNAINSRIYAFSWYLDSVADNWDVLILNKYEAVMPLPWRSKYFIKYIFPPPWTQQLGVFSKNEIEPIVIQEFITAIPTKFKKITIQFNAENKMSFLNITERKNFVLALNNSSEQIINKFNKNRKRDLVKAKEFGLKIVKNIEVPEFLEFYLELKKNYEIKLNQQETLNALLNSNNEAVCIWGIKKNSELIASLCWLKDKKRITYLLPVATAEAKRNGLPSFIISELIKTFSGTNLVLDFEGSMIEGVANFYKSFGAEVENYYLFKKKLI